MFVRRQWFASPRGISVGRSESHPVKRASLEPQMIKIPSYLLPLSLSLSLSLSLISLFLHCKIARSPYRGNLQRLAISFQEITKCFLINFQ